MLGLSDPHWALCYIQSRKTAVSSSIYDTFVYYEKLQFLFVFIDRALLLILTFIGKKLTSFCILYIILKDNFNTEHDRLYLTWIKEIWGLLYIYLLRCFSIQRSACSRFLLQNRNYFIIILRCIYWTFQ